jgi:hypothetical protein
VWRRTGSRQGWCHGEGRSAAWREKECGELDAGGATGMGIESQSLARDRLWAAVRDSLVRDLMRSRGASDAKRLQVSELRPDAGLGWDVWALALLFSFCLFPLVLV